MGLQHLPDAQELNEGLQRLDKARKSGHGMLNASGARGFWRLQRHKQIAVQKPEEKGVLRTSDDVQSNLLIVLTIL